MNTNYLSEFEQEFEQDAFELDAFELDDNEGEDYKNEADEEQEADPEMEFDYESDEESSDEGSAEWVAMDDDELEEDNEFEEDSETDYATLSRDGDYSRDREFEDRIYNALTGEHESELETEQEIDNVLEEMGEHFFGFARKLANKVAKSKAFGFARRVGGLAVRSGLINMIPGGGAITTGLNMADRVAKTARAARKKARDLVQIGRQAYQNLAEQLPYAENELEARSMGIAARRMAIADHRQKMAAARPAQRPPARRYQGVAQPQSSFIQHRSAGHSMSRKRIAIPAHAKVSVQGHSVFFNGQKIASRTARGVIRLGQQYVTILEPKQ